MELKPQDIVAVDARGAPVRLSGPSTTAIMLFGQDEGGVAELARTMTRGVEDLLQIDAATLGARMGDILSMLASDGLFATTGAVVIRGATDAHFARIEAAVAATHGSSSKLVICAGDLKQGSKLRKLFAASKTTVSAPLYRMRGREIEAYARDALALLEVCPDRPALARLGEILPADRALARRECEILALYAGGKGAKIGLRDVEAALLASDETALHEAIDAAVACEAGPSVRCALAKIEDGENPIALLRIFSRRLFQLREIRAATETRGLSVREAVDAAKPPVFWSEKDRTMRIVSATDTGRIDAALSALDLCEHACVEERIPPHLALTRALVSIARATAPSPRESFL